MTEHPTASWEAMQDGNVFYRRQQLYSIQGKLPNLEDYIVAGCRYGGPLGRLTSPRTSISADDISPYEGHFEAHCIGPICTSCEK